MSHELRSLVGQSLMVCFHGRSATPDVLELLTETRPAGVILFAYNVGTPAELHALTSALQAHAAALGLPPLLIGIDQEGGAVTRLPAPFATVPSQMAQAATGDPAAAYECARITGEQLHAFGINVNFAPSLDVNNNPRNPVINTRSFGATPELVTEFGLAALRGYAATGVVATAKHFPGHGDTQVDSHHGLPAVPHDRSRLDALELAPFVAAFGAQVPALMTAHIVFETVDAAPATLSRAILTDLLRGELGYDGVVFTDALEMRAIAARYTPVEAALRSKAAGADVLLPLGTTDSQIEIAAALADAAAADDIPLDAFRQTAERLDRLRREFGIGYAAAPFAEPATELQERAYAVAARSITRVQGGDAFPLDAGTRLLLVDCVLPRFSLAEEALERAQLLRSLAADRFPRLASCAPGPEPTAAELAAAVEQAQAAEAVLFVTRSALDQPWQLQLGAELVATGRPIIHAAVRVPYEAGRIPGVAAALVTYGDAAVSLRALIDVVAGAIEPLGRAPVTLEEPS